MEAAQILTLPAKRQREVGLTYEQFRTYLAQRNQYVSRRWLQERRAEGMPHFLDATGRMRFYPSQAMAWLEHWAEKRGRKIA